MTDALFSAVELSTGDIRTGYRLHRIEVFNWGTFDGVVWSLDSRGQTTLLTGDIGSGKSTLVDAITTLLLPAHRIAYNKAAGADTRERTLRSYVEGHHKSERNEATGASRPVGLRDHRSFSVILGVFTNEGFDEAVTIAQVFHQKDRTGQPDRFYVTAPSSLSITTAFSDFGADLRALRSQLRSRGAEIDNTFPDYARRVRRLLGIPSEQAMDLFHQTVSMKSVGNLNDFVRDHMLEPVEAETRVRAIVDHFENLTKAHEAVITATEQLELLNPLVAAAERFDAAAERQRQHHTEREAVGVFISEQILALLDELVAALRREHTATEERRASLLADRRRLDRARENLITERAGAGGDRLARLEADIPSAQAQLEERAERRRRFDTHLEAAGLDPIRDAQTFHSRSAQAMSAREHIARQRREVQEQQGPLLERKSVLRSNAARLKAEIRGFESRRNNLPEILVTIREQLCIALGASETEFPFAGELMDVSDGFDEWRGAAERVLRGFALTLLVPQRLYSAASEWVNDRHLGARLVFLRVAERNVRITPQPGGDGLRLLDVLAVEQSEFRDFVVSELARRADHRLVNGAPELLNLDRAVTREGFVRDRDRHEKDDRRRANDARYWVLGRGSEHKIAALREELAEFTRKLEQAEHALTQFDRDLEAVRGRDAALTSLAEYISWPELDTDGARLHLEELDEERERLVAGSSKLAELDYRLTSLAEDMERSDSALTEVHEQLGALGSRLGDLDSRQDREAASLARHPPAALEAARASYAALEKRRGRAGPSTIDECDDLRATLTSSLTAAIETAQREMNGLTTSIQQQMGEALRRWPVLRDELDASVQSIGGFRTLHERVSRDDLPRFEAEFKRLLNTEAVRELAQFHAWLRRNADGIYDRVGRINEALAAIEYNPGRIIRLIAEPTINQEIRQFRAELRDATSDILAGDESDAAARFERVRGIVERFQGRSNHSDSDRAWTHRVTDVRNWFAFAASEQNTETGEEFEHYTDSDGKSGGQKEKLAYTILAASLAYQFKLDWGVDRSREFRFVVIDEAFGRGSDVSTRYALELFAKLDLQLLIVTPLQKVHVIEPFVHAIGYVDNPSGAASRVHTLTIEEYRQRKREGPA